MKHKSIFTLLLSLFLFEIIFSACPDNAIEIAPKDKPYFARAAVQHNDSLIVVSGNDDLRYNSGSILSLDLKLIDNKLQNFQDKNLDLKKRVIKGSEVVKSFKNLDSFGGQPTFFPNTDTLLIATRSENKITQFELKNQQLKPGMSLLSAFRDPYYVQTFEHEGQKMALIASRTSPQLQIVKLANGKINFTSNKISLANLDLHKSNIKDSCNKNKDASKKILAIRGIKIVTPASANSEDPILFILLDVFGSKETKYVKSEKALIIWLTLDSEVLNGKLKKENIKKFDFTKEGLGTHCKDLSLAPNSSMMYVVLHKPDSIVGIDYKTFDTGQQRRVISGVSTCEEPKTILADQDSVFVTCFNDSAVVAYDRFSLEETHINRFFGRGPFLLSADSRDSATNRLYVTYFESSSVGLFTKTLVPLGQIFSQQTAKKGE